MRIVVVAVVVSPGAIREMIRVGSTVIELVIFVRFIFGRAIGRRAVENGQHCKILAQAFDAVPDLRRLPASGAQQGIVYAD